MFINCVPARHFRRRSRVKVHINQENGTWRRRRQHNGYTRYRFAQVSIYVRCSVSNESSYRTPHPRGLLYTSHGSCSVYAHTPLHIIIYPRPNHFPVVIRSIMSHNIRLWPFIPHKTAGCHPTRVLPPITIAAEIMKMIEFGFFITLTWGYRTADISYFNWIWCFGKKKKKLF